MTKEYMQVEIEIDKASEASARASAADYHGGGWTLDVSYNSKQKDHHTGEIKEYMRYSFSRGFKKSLS